MAQARRGTLRGGHVGPDAAVAAVQPDGDLRRAGGHRVDIAVAVEVAESHDFSAGERAVDGVRVCKWNLRGRRGQSRPAKEEKNRAQKENRTKRGGRRTM